jgi:hypothetical protein
MSAPVAQARGGGGPAVLSVAGLLFFVGCLVRGAHIFPPAATADRFAPWATRPAYAAGYFILIAGVSLSVIGYGALRARLGGGLATAAMACAVVGAQFLLVLFGGALILSPAAAGAYLAGDHGAVEMAEHALAGPTVRAVSGLIAVNIIGHVLFAIALWRAHPPSRIAAVPFVLAPIFLCLPSYYPIELAGGVLFLVAGLLLARAQPTLEATLPLGG